MKISLPTAAEARRLGGRGGRGGAGAGGGGVMDLRESTWF